ncbi:MAG: glycosyltransferase, partial [Blastocatellia bacterium]
MPKQPPLRVLYVAYWGLTEPLGQSLILPAIKRLAQLGVDLTLVTFEKPRDVARVNEIRSLQDSLQELGVRWTPLKYHKQPRVPATVFDIAHGCARAILGGLRVRPDVIHARTFVGGLIGLSIAPILRARLVYHNEGFYPDEQVDGGFWAAGSFQHRLAKRLENRMYARSDGIIALSHRAKREIDQMSEVQRKQTPVIVVPSCVDLDRFQLGQAPDLAPDQVLRLVYIGSIGGRYQLDKMARMVKVASDRGVRIHLSVLSGADRGAVESILPGAGLSDSAWSLDSVPHREIPGRLAQTHAGVLFLNRGISERGCSPTKIGEYWATGLPVVTTPNISDTEDIIRNERVGVIVENHSDGDYLKAIQELRALLADQGTAERCRRAAEM